jgi:hypothetical protein
VPRESKIIIPWEVSWGAGKEYMHLRKVYYWEMQQDKNTQDIIKLPRFSAYAWIKHEVKITMYSSNSFKWIRVNRIMQWYTLSTRRSCSERHVYVSWRIVRNICNEYFTLSYCYGNYFFLPDTPKLTLYIYIYIYKQKPCIYCYTR